MAACRQTPNAVSIQLPPPATPRTVMLAFMIDRKLTRSVSAGPPRDQPSWKSAFVERASGQACVEHSARPILLACV